MRIPIGTYRIQFTADFGFQAAEEIIPFLAELGISDVYASPIFRSRKGSLHGYDIVDPNCLNPELGSDSGFDGLLETVKRYDMGWLQDIVPNHMAFDFENGTLTDVLENGPRSRFFRFFDIDWDHPYESIKGRVLAPFLGRTYGEVLEEGELSLKYDMNGFAVSYGALKFPLRIGSYGEVLGYRLGDLKRKMGRDHPDFINLLGILYVLANLESVEAVSERYDQINFIKRILWELYHRNPDIQEFIHENCRIFCGQKGDPESFVPLDNLLYGQFFRLSFWKVATEEINYRRFFSINDLICLRVEDKAVFDHNHSLIFKLVHTGKFSGLRIDHVDGLRDPQGYLEKVRSQAGDTFVVVEKILNPEEALPASWPAQGTTGYDFTNFVNGLFCENRNDKALSRIYRDFSGMKGSYESILMANKRLIIEKYMGGDVDNLALLLKSISARDRFGRDITLYGLRNALVSILAFFPVYRTYIRKGAYTETDFETIQTAVNKAVRNNPDLLKELDFIRKFLLLEKADYLSEEEMEDRVRFVMRFQQFTGPLMAKGFEDTMMYVFNRLLSLNEVGGDLSRLGISVEEFHRYNDMKSRHWPSSLNATSTHDTKRGEDVRARINVISEIPGEWGTALKSWRKINAKKKKRIHGTAIPDPNDEYFLYQTLLGVFPPSGIVDPSFITRITDYVIKAVREAKIHTEWLKPDSDYEGAYTAFVHGILDTDRENPFLEAFLPFQKKIAFYGIFNSLSQTLLKITSPGVPDFYQGTELWDLSLVDPDNRRPVDYEKRRRFLREIRESRDRLYPIDGLMSPENEGMIKLFLIHQGLKARHEFRETFQEGAYIPLAAGGAFREHIIAFARNRGRKWAITIVPRFLTRVIKEGEFPLGRKVWNDTYIALPDDAPRLWTDRMTQEVIRAGNTCVIGDVMTAFPVSLLTGEGEAEGQDK